MIKAVIFDMDGVLINSEIVYIKLLEQFLAESGVFVKREELYFLAGAPRSEDERFLAEKLKMDAKEINMKKDAFFVQHPIDYRSIRKAYVTELLAYLKKRHIMMALASSSTLENIEEVLLACEISDYFAFCVSGDQFVKTKPDPQIYEYCVQQLGYAKHEILVVEDSTYGIEAAKRAGLKVAAVLDPVLCFDVSRADVVMHTLREVKQLVL